MASFGTIRRKSDSSNESSQDEKMESLKVSSVFSIKKKIDAIYLKIEQF